MAKVLESRGIEKSDIDEPAKLKKRLSDMSASEDPIEVYLPGEGLCYVFYEDSYVLAQMQYYPLIQLILIAVFLLVAYLVFSSFRRAERQGLGWNGEGNCPPTRNSFELSYGLGYYLVLSRQAQRRNEKGHQDSHSYRQV